MIPLRINEAHARLSNRLFQQERPEGVSDDKHPVMSTIPLFIGTLQFKGQVEYGAGQRYSRYMELRPILDLPVTQIFCRRNYGIGDFRAVPLGIGELRPKIRLQPRID